MKKILPILFVSMLTMAAMAFGQPPFIRDPYFVITNKATNQTKTATLEECNTLMGFTASFSSGVYSGDQIEIAFKSTLVSLPQLEWFYGWLDYDPAVNRRIGTGLTAKLTVTNVPTPDSYNNTLIINCNCQSDGTDGCTTTTYRFLIPNVRQGSRVTAKNINASEVQVTYADYEKVVSAGQRATVDLYDIYGNKVSGGYLDNLGMGTFSTKGKPGYYIVKVMVNNQVIFTETLQVK